MLEHPYICEVDELRSRLVDYQFSGWDLSGHLSSPRQLVAVLENRQSISRTAQVGMALPTDIFLFTAGEPSRRDVTKIGGLPYRPTGLEWPTYKSISADDHHMSGIPLSFLAQFRFTESVDAQSHLPGDVMLIFAYSECIWNDQDPNIKIEWYSLGLSDLCTQSELPKSDWSFFTGYGCRLRMLDFPFAFDTEIEPCGFNGHGIQCLNCTKIGGFPIGVCDIPTSEIYALEHSLVGRWKSSIDIADVTLLGTKFLCSLGSVQFVPDVEWPMIHRKPPLPLGDIRGSNELSIGYDMWAVDFFIDNAGDVTWKMVWP